MATLGIDFKSVNGRPVGHTDMNCHLVFDIKIDFTRKFSYVAGEHLTEPPDKFPTYASIISCKLVHILFLIAALYNTKVLAADISNSLLSAQCANKGFFKGRAQI